MPKTAYLITQHGFALADLGNFLDAVGPDYAVTESETKIVVDSCGHHVDYCKFELETRALLLDEWYPDNPVFDLLLNNEHFGGSSSAFFATFCTPASPPFVAVVRSLVAHNVDCLVYNCHNMTVPGQEFQSILESNRDWQWHIKNVPS